MEAHLKHLEFISGQALVIMHNYNRVDMNRVPYAYMELLTRVRASARGLIKLLSSIEEEPELEFSAALIVRTMILDFFISLSGYDIRLRGADDAKNDAVVKTEIEQLFNSVLGDGLKLTANHFARMESNGHIDEPKLHCVLQNLTDRYSMFLQPYANDKKVVPRFPNGPRNDQIFDRISSNPKLKNFAKHFEAYALYSKYEHFSIMSFDTIRRDEAVQQSTLKEMLEILLLHTYQIVSMLRFYFQDDFITAKNVEVGTYIYKEVFNLKDEEIVELLAAG